jgi:hypothetical protein
MRTWLPTCLSTGLATFFAIACFTIPPTHSCVAARRRLRRRRGEVQGGAKRNHLDAAEAHDISDTLRHRVVAIREDW